MDKQKIEVKVVITDTYVVEFETDNSNPDADLKKAKLIVMEGKTDIKEESLSFIKQTKEYKMEAK